MSLFDIEYFKRELVDLAYFINLVWKKLCGCLTVLSFSYFVILPIKFQWCQFFDIIISFDNDDPNSSKKCLCLVLVYKYKKELNV